MISRAETVYPWDQKNLALVLSGAVGKSLPIPGTEFCSDLSSLGSNWLIYSLGCCGEALHNWWVWVIFMKLLHYWMLCLSLLQPGCILETFSLFLSISLQNAMQQGKRLSFQALLECQRFRGWIWPGIWNSAVWRERENTWMGKKRNQDVLTLRKCKGEKETGAEERNRRVSFYSKRAVLTAGDQRNWRHRMEKLRSLIHGKSQEQQRGPPRDTGQNLEKSQEWWTSAWSSILLFYYFTSIFMVLALVRVKDHGF